MRNVQRVLSGLGLFGAALVVGCNGGSSDTGEAVGSSEARIVLVAQGSSSANMHLTATNDITGEVAIDQFVNVDVSDSVVIDATLDAASYSLHLEAFADESHTDILASGDAHLEVQANLATEIFLAADTDAGKAGSGVSVSIHDVPTIDDVVVHHSTGSITIDVSAQNASGGTLTYFWSGFGLEVAVEGSSSLTIPAASALLLDAIDGETTLHLVVQNADGATASVDIDLSATVNGEACVFCNAGTTSGDDIISIGNGDVDILACLDARVSCNLACTAEAGAPPLDFAGALVSCTTECGLQLTSCEAGET